MRTNKKCIGERLPNGKRVPCGRQATKGRLCNKCRSGAYYALVKVSHPECRHTAPPVISEQERRQRKLELQQEHKCPDCGQMIFSQFWLEWSLKHNSTDAPEATLRLSRGDVGLLMRSLLRSLSDTPPRELPMHAALYGKLSRAFIEILPAGTKRAVGDAIDRVIGR